MTDAQGNHIGWQQVDVKLTPAQEARVKDIYYRDLKATVGFEAVWQAIADRDDPYSAPDRGGITRGALLEEESTLEPLRGGCWPLVTFGRLTDVHPKLESSALGCIMNRTPFFDPKKGVPYPAVRPQSGSDGDAVGKMQSIVWIQIFSCKAVHAAYDTIICFQLRLICLHSCCLT